MKIKTLFSRILLTATLTAGLAGIVGCNEGTNVTKRVEYHTPFNNNDKPCEFTNFGYVPWSYEKNGANVTIAVGDMDGDGALDIIVANSSGEITIYKNKIPQQNK